MSSGQKLMVLNTRERVLSTDHNRLQSFIACDRSQLARFQYNDKRQNYFSLPGVTSQYVGGETPLAADVFGGLMVDPQATSLLVTPGELGCLFPDPSITADDSPYMLINDPGLQTAGILTFTANGGGGTRVDLVECQPQLVTLESDSRDIFNPATGLFAPASVNKVQAFRLQYRIRLGTPSAGIPALAAGWLPLAVSIVSTAATDFNGCDFYDVRPLVEDRVRPQIPGDSTVPQNYPLRDSEYGIVLNSGAYLLSGYAFSEFGGYLAGGQLRRSTPSFSGTRGGGGNGDGDPTFINLSIAENQGNSFSHTANAMNAVGAFFPAGLPRWVRYSQSAIGGGFGRVPRGPRGIVAVIKGGTGTNNRLVTSALPIFGTCNGVLLATAKSNGGGTDFTVANAQGQWEYTESPLAMTPFASSAGSQSFKFQVETGYPSSAKELLVAFEILFTDSVIEDGFATAEVQDATAVSVQPLPEVAWNAPDTSTHRAIITMRVPVPARPIWSDTASETSFFVVFSFGSVTITPNSGSRARIQGWRI